MVSKGYGSNSDELRQGWRVGAVTLIETMVFHLFLTDLYIE